MRYAHLLYLALALLMFVAAMIVYVWRPDLRRAIVTAGLVGVVIEVGSDLLWYLRDYWHPPTVLPVPVIEDTLFGFGVTALAVCAVPFWCRWTYEPMPSTHEPHRNWRPVMNTGLLLLAFAAVMTIMQVFTDVNSIWVATGCFVVAGIAVAISGRPDLWWVGPIAGLIMALVALIGYFLGLDVLIDGDAFLRQVYLLYATSLDVRIPGTNVLVDELAWFFARGWCIAVLYPLLTHQQLRRLG